MPLAPLLSSLPKVRARTEECEVELTFWNDCWTLMKFEFFLLFGGFPRRWRLLEVRFFLIFLINRIPGLLVCPQCRVSWLSAVSSVTRLWSAPP